MAKFYGKIGYAASVEAAPGVYEETITEYSYFGDVIRNARRLDAGGEKVNSDLTISNSISIVADAYAYDHFFDMRYIVWMNNYWSLTNVEVQRPRLILQLGGLYNGPKA